jgi:mannose-6-phosphate isomerase
MPATGGPMAEIWFGTHPGSMTQCVGGGSLLEERGGEPLDFLLKILAAGQPLSLQAHPNLEQAADGFDRENALGIPLAAPERNYKDRGHKPEMLVALTPFVALAGFRPVPESVRLFEQLAAIDDSLLANEFSHWLTLLQTGLRNLFVELTNLRGSLDSVTSALARVEPSMVPGSEPQLQLVKQLQELYPGDPGIIISMLMNQVHLAPGEAVQVAAGQVHAYVRGLGVEVMASSDNVLRGGLTPKHINVNELLRVVDFRGEAAKVDQAKMLANGLFEYPSHVEDYLLYRLEVSPSNLLVDLKLPQAAVVLCTSGELAVSNSLGEREVIKRGQAAYLANANFVSFAGSGQGFLATT